MTEATWWQRGVIYQIYPRSFMDGNGDGVGDLPGILDRLDYLTWLGVDAVWLSPVHPSPMDDFGYDISDDTGVDPVFGTLADLDRLVAAAHERGVRVLLDRVPNRTSDRHPWFLASRASREDPKRDWYIWRDPQVQEAMFDNLRFWLARGIDGFRVDALAALPAGAWPNWVLGNHDTPRVASRLGPTDVPIPSEAALDPIARLVPGRGRDPERTPMPWEAGPGGGFTSGRPWLPLGEDNLARNVAAQRGDEGMVAG
jgi:glycosidase